MSSAIPSRRNGTRAAPTARSRKFDDLPAQYLTNVNTDPPFGGKPGGKPALSDAEIDDIVAFLGTLTDGYRRRAEPAKTFPRRAGMETPVLPTACGARTLLFSPCACSGLPPPLI